MNNQYLCLEYSKYRIDWNEFSERWSVENRNNQLCTDNGKIKWCLLYIEIKLYLLFVIVSFKLNCELLLKNI